MRTYVGHQVAVNTVASDEPAFAQYEDEDENPVYGPEDFRTLFVGEPGETDAEADARAEVAREVFAELMDEGTEDEIGRLNAAYAAWLLCSVSLRPRRPHRAERDVSGMGAAA